MVEFGVVKRIEEWDSLLSQLNRDFDVYWKKDYFRLYLSGQQKAEAIVYWEGDSFFLLPYIRTDHKISGKIYFDLETPHGYGGPLSNSSDKEFHMRASGQMREFLENDGGIAAFIRFHPIFKNQALLSWTPSPALECQTVLVNLTLSENDIWVNQIHSKHRNVIKKAIENGLVYEADYEFKTLNEFKEIYSETMSRIGAEEGYLYDDSYFECLKDAFLGTAFIACVRKDNRIVSSAIIFVDNGFANYHLAGSKEDFLSLYPNNFLIHQTILHLKKSGATSFHLGGGGRIQSLFNFKKRFSKDTADFYIGKFILNSEIYSSLTESWVLSNPVLAPRFQNYFLKYRL